MKGDLLNIHFRFWFSFSSFELGTEAAVICDNVRHFS